jgi:hypothetical protein
MQETYPKGDYRNTGATKIKGQIEEEEERNNQQSCMHNNHVVTSQNILLLTKLCPRHILNDLDILHKFITIK